jgi:quercetin dioxygenase-like cupin family protein
MSDHLSLRRLVTARTADDKAYVAIDAEITNLKTGASGSTVRHVWNTRETPADIRVGAFDDPGAEPHITPPPANGTRFAVIDFPPGNTGVMHRTESLDYVIVLEGEIDMDIDDETVRMKAGDVLVQRGTNHAWCNRSDAAARVAFILVDAQPLGIGNPRTTH